MKALPKPAAPVRGIVAVRADAGGNPMELIERINAAVAEQRENHAAEIAGVRAGFDDVLTREKGERIEASIADLTAQLEAANERIAAASQAGPADDNVSPEARQYAENFNAYMRTGRNESDVQAANQAGGIMAAYSVGADEDGGYTSPVEWDRTITTARREISPMRMYASVQSISGRGFTKLYNMGGTNAGWVGETDNRPVTDTSKLRNYSFSFGELYAQPSATQTILDDSEISIEAWLRDEVNFAFANQEGIAFLSGDGQDKPAGLLTFDAAGEAARPANKRHPLGAIAEKSSGAANGITPDGLQDLVYDLPADRSNGAAFFGNRQTHAALRKMKDGDGNYLWSAPFETGQSPTVLGAPLRELSGMPNIAANAIALAYGNMAETYRIFDRVGIRVLRDPYTAKPYVLFYTTKRVGGGLWNPEFMRFLRIAA